THVIHVRERFPQDRVPKRHRQGRQLDVIHPPNGATHVVREPPKQRHRIPTQQGRVTLLEEAHDLKLDIPTVLLTHPLSHEEPTPHRLRYVTRHHTPGKLPRQRPTGVQE